MADSHSGFGFCKFDFREEFVTEGLQAPKIKATKNSLFTELKLLGFVATNIPYPCQFKGFKVNLKSKRGVRNPTLEQIIYLYYQIHGL